MTHALSLAGDLLLQRCKPRVTVVEARWVMRFRIQAADPDTGDEVVWEINAATVHEARRRATASGFLVTRIEPCSDDAAPRDGTIDKVGTTGPPLVVEGQRVEYSDLATAIPSICIAPPTSQPIGNADASGNSARPSQVAALNSIAMAVPARGQVDEIGPHGIRGWLVIHAIWIFVVMANALCGIGAMFPLIDSTQNSPKAPEPLRTVILAALLVSTVKLVYMSFVLYYFFNRRTQARQLIITFLLLNALWQCIFVALTSVIAGRVVFVPQNVIAVAWSAIWIPYFWKSKRVKNTFRWHSARVDGRVW